MIWNSDDMLSDEYIEMHNLSLSAAFKMHGGLRPIKTKYVKNDKPNKQQAVSLTMR